MVLTMGGLPSFYDSNALATLPMEKQDLCASGSALGEEPLPSMCFGKTIWMPL